MLHRRLALALPGVAGLLAALVSGCTGAVRIDAAALPAAQAEACAAFTADLPRVLDGLPAREVSPVEAAGRAWGDPAVVVTCGVQRPEGLDRFSSCEDVDGVGWFVTPQEAYDDPAADVSLTTIGARPPVRIDVPGEQRPPADVLATVSPLVREHLRIVRSCV